MKMLKVLLLVAVVWMPGVVRAQLGISEIVIDAFVDGPSTLHLTPEGVYWTNGNNKKPGRWGGTDFPTYVNGAEWKPAWSNPKESGPDKSGLYAIKLGTVDVNYNLISVRQERGQNGKDKRTPITAKKEGAEFIVIIPDPESGPRWYKFALRKR